MIFFLFLLKTKIVAMRMYPTHTHNLCFRAKIRKTRTVRGSDYSPAIKLSEQKEKSVTATGDTEKYSEKQANKVWLNFVYLRY